MCEDALASKPWTEDTWHALGRRWRIISPTKRNAQRASVGLKTHIEATSQLSASPFLVLSTAASSVVSWRTRKKSKGFSSHVQSALMFTDYAPMSVFPEINVKHV